jgi:hypothetical protein
LGLTDLPLGEAYTGGMVASNWAIDDVVRENLAG